MKTKWKHLVLPFVTMLILVLGAASIIHYVFVIRTAWLPLTYFQAEVILPGVLCLLAPFIVLRKRIKRWVLPRRGEDATFALTFMAALCVGAPVFVVQHWIGLAGAQLKAVGTVNELVQLGPRDHATLQAHYMDRANGQGEIYVHTSGKHDQYLHFDIYFAIPIRPDASDTLGPVVAWLGLKSPFQMDSDAPEAEKERAYQAHIDSSIAVLNRADLEQFDHLKNLAADNGLEHYEAAVRKSPFYTEGAPIALFEASTELFGQRAAGMAGYSGWALAGGLALWVLIVFFMKVRGEDDVFAHAAAEKGGGTWSDLKEMALPRPGYFTTPLLIWANVLVFVALVAAGLGFIDFQADDLIAWGGNFRPAVLEGQWWRLFTAMFLHGGVMHLLFNMYGLLMVGIFLELVLGRWQVLGLYILCGLVASGTSLYWHADKVGVGASGAIFGLHGILIALLLTGAFERTFAKSLLISMLFFVGYNLLMGLKGNVDNAAHIGGLLCGLVCGGVVRLTLQRVPDEEQPS